MVIDKMTADRLVVMYRKMRARKEEIETTYKEDMEDIREQMGLVEARLLEICNEQGVESLRTLNGTVTKRATTRYWTSDWESMHNFIVENDAFQLMEQRIHNGNMKQFLEENPELMPIGLNADTRFSISVRKPTGK